MALRTVLPLMLLALTLGGCETNAQRSAQLERVARAQRRAHPLENQQGVSVKRVDPHVQILGTDVVHDENGSAVVVLMRNESSKPLRGAPISIALSDAKGTILYRNDAPGLDSTLVSVPLLMPHVQTMWIDDQIQVAGTPAKASALVGEATVLRGSTPRLHLSALHTIEDPSNGMGAEGTLMNPSRIGQQNLVVDVVGRRHGRIVAAGRAVLPELPAAGRQSFQVFFIGSPRGAALQASALPSTTE